MAMESRDPSTEDVFASFEEHDDAAVNSALDAGQEAFRDWRATPIGQRTALLHRLGDVLDQRRDRLAELASREMGKILPEARAEVEKCAGACRHFAAQAEAYLKDEPVKTERSESYVLYQPLGLLLAIMPWNFPIWQVIRFAAPALAAGNVAVLKHASNVPQCALEIEELFTEAGFPPNVFKTLLIGGDRAQRLAEDDRIAAISLTGSDRVGALVAGSAAGALKKSVLELGGSDPFVVMPSADFAAAVETGVRARTMNNGQSCIAAKRFIIHADIYDAYVNSFADRMRGLKVGPQLVEGIEMGPLALANIRDGLREQVDKTIEAGATVVSEGEVPAGRGYYFPPMVLADIPADSPGAREELFGPVALMFRAASLDEAIALANDTPFGLGASVWTNDATEKDTLIRSIEAGSVFVNAQVASDPRLPFGGVKRSGFGRELSQHGIREFVNIKTAIAA